MKVKVEGLFRHSLGTHRQRDESTSEKISNRISSTYPTGILAKENRQIVEEIIKRVFHTKRLDLQTENTECLANNLIECLAIWMQKEPHKGSLPHSPWLKCPCAPIPPTNALLIISDEVKCCLLQEVLFDSLTTSPKWSHFSKPEGP